MNSENRQINTYASIQRHRNMAVLMGRALVASGAIVLTGSMTVPMHFEKDGIEVNHVFIPAALFRSGDGIEACIEHYRKVVANGKPVPDHPGIDSEAPCEDTATIAALKGAEARSRAEEEGWIQTYTGIRFHPLKIKREDIEIEDIAHALSLVNRFTGHTHTAYSVAEHAVRCSYLFGREQPDLALEALLHDASEAYIADLARPVKMLPQMAGYREVERRIERAIADRFGLPFPMSPAVKWADETLLATEGRDLMPFGTAGWNLRERPLSNKIKPWSADLAKHRFKERFFHLVEIMGRDDLV